mgnify:CR=1 FL=1
MSIITKDLIIRALKESVMYSPQAEMKCRQLQAFKVLERGGLLVSENLGATICDLNKDWFWSRVWSANKVKAGKINWDFPLLVVIERGFTAASPLVNKGKQCVTYNISVLDKYTADCEKGACGGCSGRTINDIYADTEYLLFQALSYISGMKFITVGSTVYSMHDGELQKHLDSGAITSYTEGKGWGYIVANDTKSAEGYKTSIEAEGIFGTSINVTICNDRCYVDGFDFTKATFVP